MKTKIIERVKGKFLNQTNVLDLTSMNEETKIKVAIYKNDGVTARLMLADDNRNFTINLSYRFVFTQLNNARAKLKYCSKQKYGSEVSTNIKDLRDAASEDYQMAYGKNKLADTVDPLMIAALTETQFIVSINGKIFKLPLEDAEGKGGLIARASNIDTNQDKLSRKERIINIIENASPEDINRYFHAVTEIKANLMLGIYDLPEITTKSETIKKPQINVHECEQLNLGGIETVQEAKVAKTKKRIKELFQEANDNKFSTSKNASLEPMEPVEYSFSLPQMEPPKFAKNDKTNEEFANFEDENGKFANSEMDTNDIFANFDNPSSDAKNGHLSEYVITGKIYNFQQLIDGEGKYKFLNAGKNISKTQQLTTSAELILG